MRNIDPGLRLNCPKCPRAMRYVASHSTKDGDTHFYDCAEHGRWQLAPNGRVSPRALDDRAAKE